MKKIIIIGVLFIVTATAIAFYQYNKPHKNISHAKTEFMLTAYELYSDFEQNEPLANKKYLDKVVEVRGSIAEIQSNGEQRSLLLKGNVEGFGYVNCALNPNNNLNGYSKGDYIIVKGVCTGYLMDVVLNKCVIINQ